MPNASARATTRQHRGSTRPGLVRKGITRRLRTQGGATVFSIPAHFLAEMGVEAGADIEVSLVDGKLVAEAKVQSAPRRRRYTLAELLQGAEHLPELYGGTKGALDGPPFGQEMG